MFLEYARILASGGEIPLTVEAVLGIAIVIFAGVILVFVGFKIKGMLGAIIALLVGTFVFLYAGGFLRF
jgi:hypothetical protein